MAAADSVVPLLSVNAVSPFLSISQALLRSNDDASDTTALQHVQQLLPKVTGAASWNVSQETKW